MSTATNAYERGTPLVVGKFGERRTQRMFQFERSASSNGHGDLAASGKKRSFGVEVKASDNNHCWRISQQQLARYIEAEGFPHDAYLYYLLGYKNPKRRNSSDGSLGTILSQCSSEREIKILLAKQMNWGSFLDAQLIHAFSQKNTRRTSFMAQRETPLIPIGRTWLTELYENPTKAFERLDLDPKAWQVEKHKTSFSFKKAGTLGDVTFEMDILYAVRKQFLKEILKIPSKTIVSRIRLT